MGTWGLIQIVINIFLGLGLFLVAMRLSRAPKDDPRMSRGLQLLQSKISVLEDLSDRTEVQVNQLAALLDHKCREVQNKITLADRHVQIVRASMEKSLEVARIFQDKIPHNEIIERQNTVKYVQAARLAHQGLSVEEIAKRVELPKGELEFIAKVNRERLMFSEQDLPEWAKDETILLQPEASAGSEAVNSALMQSLQEVQFEMDRMDFDNAGGRDYSKAFESPEVPRATLEKLGEEFRRACEQVQPAPPPGMPAIFGLGGGAQEMSGADKSLQEAVDPETDKGPGPLLPLQQLRSFVQQTITQNLAPILESVTAPATAVLEGREGDGELLESTALGESGPDRPTPNSDRTTPNTESRVGSAAEDGKPRPATSVRPESPKPTAAPRATSTAQPTSPSVIVSGRTVTGNKAVADVRKVQFPRIDMKNNLS